MSIEHPDPEIERLTASLADLDPKKDRHRIDDLQSKRRAIQAFDSHEIRERGGRHFSVMRRHEDGGWTSNMGAEIFVGFWGTIYVGGDIGPVVYAYGPKDIRARIAWMGAHTDVAYYVAQKASIGTRSGNGMKVWSQEDMFLDVKDHLANYEEDHGAEPSGELKEAIEDFLHYPPESQDLAIHHFCERLNYDDAEVFLRMGETTDPDVYYTWAALRRLHLLLLAERDLACMEPSDESR